MSTRDHLSSSHSRPITCNQSAKSPAKETIQKRMQISKLSPQIYSMFRVKHCQNQLTIDPNPAKWYDCECGTTPPPNPPVDPNPPCSPPDAPMPLAYQPCIWAWAGCRPPDKWPCWPGIGTNRERAKIRLVFPSVKATNKLSTTHPLTWRSRRQTWTDPKAS